MTLLTLLDYTAEVLHLCYLLAIALFRLTVQVAVVCYVAGEMVAKHIRLPEYSFDFSRVVSNLQVYLGGTIQQCRQRWLHS